MPDSRRCGHVPVTDLLRTALAVLVAHGRELGAERAPVSGLLLDLPDAPRPRRARRARPCPWAGSSRRSEAGARPAPRPRRRRRGLVTTPPAARIDVTASVTATPGAGGRAPLPTPPQAPPGRATHRLRSISASIPSAYASGRAALGRGLRRARSRRRPRPGARRARPALGLSARARTREPGLPITGIGQLRRVAAPLGADPDPGAARRRRGRSERVDRSAQPAPCGSHRARQRVDGASGRGRREPRLDDARRASARCSCA